MWPFKRKRPAKKLFKIEYSMSCVLVSNKAVFSLDRLSETFVQADDEFDAAAKFLADECPMNPRIYIHRIVKVLEIDNT